MILTNRLILKPLSADQLEKYIDFQDELAIELGLKPSPVLIEEALKEAIRNDLLPFIADPARDPLFYTLWIVIEKETKTIVGGICFHGEPNGKGEIEIGYGIDQPFQNRGYMSEAITGFIQWIKENSKAKILKAETESDNISSIRVLEKNNFLVVQQGAESLIFELEL
jgi:[ribosomal protein S5]-alanine N-acetyltransferase